MKIIRILKTTLICLLLITVHELKAQSTNTQTMLWKVSGNGLKMDSYILLNTSNACADMVALNKKTLTALENVRGISVEAGTNDPSNEAALQKLVIVKNENGSVKKILSGGLYTQLETEASKVGINEARLNSYKPIFICGLTISVIAPCDIAAPRSTEKLLRTYAHDKNIKVGELLSLNETFDILDSYPNSYWEKTLNFLINNSSQAASDLDDKTNFYKHENLRGLYAILNKSELFKLRYAYNDVETKRINLLDSRIETAIKAQSTLILLDASAVANPGTSLFSLLTKSGYLISPIFN